MKSKTKFEVDIHVNKVQLQNMLMVSYLSIQNSVSLICKTLTKLKAYYFEPVTSDVCWQTTNNELWLPVMKFKYLLI